MLGPGLDGQAGAQVGLAKEPEQLPAGMHRAARALSLSLRRPDRQQAAQPLQRAWAVTRRHGLLQVKVKLVLVRMVAQAEVQADQEAMAELQVKVKGLQVERVLLMVPRAQRAQRAEA